MREVSFHQNFWSPGQLDQAAVQPLKQAHSVLHMIAVFGRRNPWSLDQSPSQAAVSPLLPTRYPPHMTAVTDLRYPFDRHLYPCKLAATLPLPHTHSSRQTTVASNHIQLLER